MKEKLFNCASRCVAERRSEELRLKSQSTTESASRVWKPVRTSDKLGRRVETVPCRGFSLVEMLMALLVASLLMVSLAPVMTKKFNENVNILGVTGEATPRRKVHEIEYNSAECVPVSGADYCQGTFVVPTGFNGSITVTLVGAGGGGAGGATAGYTNYTTIGDNSFVVPEMAAKVEATLIEGGAGGGSGWIDTNIKGIAWTHSGMLQRAFVSTSSVTDNLTNRSVSPTTSTAANTATSYTSGTGTLTADDTKNLAGGKVFVTMSGGGGGGGRGYRGTGGGGGASYSRKAVSVTRGSSHTIKVASGGKGHACNGNAGCGGAASKFGTLLTAGGGGGGTWSSMGSPRLPTPGENGGAMPTITEGTCVWQDVTTNFATGGRGASPGGGDGGSIVCSTSIKSDQAPGTDGGSSTFGTFGTYNESDSSVRDGRGYGAGGCGGGACPECYGNGAPGFVAVEFYNFLNGGGGGGAGSIMPLKQYAANPKETLTVTIGEGGKGANPPTIKDDLTYALGSGKGIGWAGGVSYLKRGSTVLLKTSSNHGQAADCGSCPGSYNGNLSTGNLGCQGWVSSCGNSAGSEGFHLSDGDFCRRNSSAPNFITCSARRAGNRPYIDDTTTYTISDKGGDGGYLTTPFTGSCTRGAGSTTFDTKGGDGGNYGCGGGGGYGLAGGGKGGDGWGRVSWNKFWNIETSEYDYNATGGGGGGASGNVLKFNLMVNSGQRITFRIGKGGTGGVWVSGTSYTPATKGGDTIFGNLKAGGGKGGNPPTVSGAELLNGTGGEISNICHNGGKSLLEDTTRCTKGAAGKANELATSPNGGDGGTSPLKGSSGSDLPWGLGGNGGRAGVGSTPTGANASGFGAGGGGAGLKDLAATTSVSSAEGGAQGGSGSNGKIVLTWYE